MRNAYRTQAETKENEMRAVKTLALINN